MFVYREFYTRVGTVVLSLELRGNGWESNLHSLSSIYESRVQLIHSSEVSDYISMWEATALYIVCGKIGSVLESVLRIHILKVLESQYKEATYQEDHRNIFILKTSYLYRL